MTKGDEIGVGALASCAADAPSAAVASPSALEHPASMMIDSRMRHRVTRIIALAIVLGFQARYDSEYVSTLARNCGARSYLTPGPSPRAERGELG
ncbi:MAG: hypothetical protein L0177_00460 [Chloroflexi bacterium]|nr:hypothetical protein [Chloroflexota bacterium]